ncbi:MAG: hypothetical protein Q7I99_05775 [Acholeplasmataceae bacterium]|nr:hypothetical protein [Acholeplasmataceae bacterium]
MKKMSIVLILLSSALSFFSHLINQINTLIFSLPMFYPAVDLFIRFDELLIIFGFIGLFITTMKHPKMKFYSLLFAIISMIRFLIIEFGLLGSYDLPTNILLLFQIVVLTLWLLEVKTVEVPLLTIKGYALIIIIYVYFIAVQAISLIPYELSNSTPRATLTVLPFFIMSYHIGLWVYFKEWYKEAYIYKNPDLSRI